MCAILLGDMYIWWNRNSFMPFKCMSIPLFILSSFGAIIWMVSIIITDEHFEREPGDIVSICPLWSFWGNLYFGQNLWMNCLNVRIVRVYYIFILKQKPPKTRDMLALFLFPTLVFCLIATWMRASQYDNHGCSIISLAWKGGLFFILVLPFLQFVAYSYLIRHLKIEVIEFKALLTSGLIAIVLWIISGVLLLDDRQETVAGRCVVSFLTAFIVNYFYWSQMGKPMYACFRKDATFIQKFEVIFRTANPYLFDAKLDDLIQDKKWRAKFKEYADELHSLENIEFWEACEQRDELIATRGPKEVTNFTKRLINTYISDKASRQVNLSGNIKMDILNDKDLTSATLFTRAREDVILLMDHNLFRYFIMDPRYQEWQANEAGVAKIGELVAEESRGTSGISGFARRSMYRNSMAHKDHVIGSKDGSESASLISGEGEVDFDAGAAIKAPTEEQLSRPKLQALIDNIVSSNNKSAVTRVSTGGTTNLKGSTGVYADNIGMISINLSDKDLKEIPPSQVEGCVKLFFNGNCLPILSISNELVHALKHCSALYLSCCQITTLDSSIYMLKKSLVALSLSNNQLTTLPNEICTLSHLAEFTCAFNYLSSIPEDLGNLTSLTLLNLSNNSLSSLPALAGLVNLRELYANNNALTSLPNLPTQLRVIDVSFNNITSLHESFGEITPLQKLNIESNQLSRIPSSFLKFRYLRIFRYNNNSLPSVPKGAALQTIRLLVTALDPNAAAAANMLEKAGTM